MMYVYVSPGLYYIILYDIFDTTQVYYFVHVIWLSNNRCLIML